ncbi:MAG: hypothetical protein PUE32_05685 [Clostridia bacterium]|nr:hypothetical protein [Clostridia bacterium]MDY5807616.1 hypothetical protein [Lachnospira sp.]
MAELEFRKQLLINEFKTLSKGKSKEELLPLMLALSNKAKQAGVQFTKDDLLIVISQVDSQLTETERKLIPEILAMMNK